MTKKTTPPDLTVLNLKATNDEEMNLAVNLARNVATNTHVHAGSAQQPWLKMTYGDVAINELVTKLRTQTEAMKGGDMGDIEAMLFNQALTLQTMFTALSRRAAMNVGEYTNTVEIYLKLAFKAQSQCRTTLESLAEIKQPRLATFVRQANIANGPQQVNNGTSATGNDPRAPARELSGNQPNELITDERATNVNPMDTRSTPAASASDSSVEALAAR